MRGGEGRILVIDDEAVVLESCRRVLAAEGYGTETACGVPEALERLRAGGFRLVIADILLPGQDGLGFLAEMTRSTPGLPVLMCSGYPTEELVARCRGLRAAGFLAKPFTPEELLEAVRAALEEQP